MSLGQKFVVLASLFVGFSTGLQEFGLYGAVLGTFIGYVLGHISALILHILESVAQYALDSIYYRIGSV